MATTDTTTQPTNLTDATNVSSAGNTAIPTVTNQDGTTSTIQQFAADQVNNPTLAPGTQITAQQIQDTPATDLSSPGSQLTGSVAQNASQTTAAPAVAAATNDAANTAAQYQQYATDGSQYNASTVSGQTPTSVAAQGTVSADDTVAGQYAKLTSGLDGSGNVPDWAKGAVSNAQGILASRGLGSSSIAAGAITGALMAAALPIASADASTYFAMNMKNLDNQQQSELANVQIQQQALLSDQSAENAAKQFNASSQQQVNEYFGNLIAGIQSANAARTDAISQFNAAQSNQVGETNTAQDNAMKTLNEQIANQRQQFNAQNQLTIDQSNAQWRRTINTDNTAATNAANQANAQNLFNLSAQDQANLWQEYRDEASWLNQSQENDATRQQQLALVALNRQTDVQLQDTASTNAFYQSLGAFATNLLGAVIKK